MGSRDSNRAIAIDTMNCLNNGFYMRNGKKIKFNDNIFDTQSTTIVPQDIVSHSRKGSTDSIKRTCKISVIDTSTIYTAIDLCRKYPNDKILVLNFASACRVGGGFLSGSNAQEESIMRATTAYPTLQKSPLFYKINRRSGTPLYTDTMVYSPNIEIFKDDNGGYLPSPLQCNLLTVPAVNARIARNHDIKWSTINTTMQYRIARIIDFIYHKGFDKVVLGAFGCGVFKNKPTVIATAFKTAIDYYDAKYKANIEFIFAIKDKSNKLINIFNNIVCK